MNKRTLRAMAKKELDGMRATPGADEDLPGYGALVWIGWMCGFTVALLAMSFTMEWWPFSWPHDVGRVGAATFALYLLLLAAWGRWIHERRLREIERTILRDQARYERERKVAEMLEEDE